LILYSDEKEFGDGETIGKLSSINEVGASSNKFEENLLVGTIISCPLSSIPTF